VNAGCGGDHGDTSIKKQGTRAVALAWIAWHGGRDGLTGRQVGGMFMRMAVAALETARLLSESRPRASSRS
jgi:hypothetical protein